MLLFFSNCWLFFHWCFLDSPATFSNFIGLAYSLVFFTHLAFAQSTWQDTLCCAVFTNEAMKYKGLIVDPKNKPFGNLLPFEVQVIIMFRTQCFMTNARRTKMNEELTRLPCCLRTGIQMSVAFSFSSGYKRFPFQTLSSLLRLSPLFQKEHTTSVGKCVHLFPFSFISCLPLTFCLFPVD